MKALLPAFVPLFVPRTAFWSVVLLGGLFLARATEDALAWMLIGLGMGAGFALGNRVGTDITRGTAEYLGQLPMTSGKTHQVAQLFGFALLMLLVGSSWLVHVSQLDQWMVQGLLGRDSSRIAPEAHADVLLLNLVVPAAFSYWTAVTARLRCSSALRTLGWGWVPLQVITCIAVPLLHRLLLSHGLGEPLVMTWVVLMAPTCMLLLPTIQLARRSLTLARKLGPEAWPAAEDT